MKIDEMTGSDEVNLPPQSELRRRFGWEFDGMRLHEYYFENLGKTKDKMLKKSPLHLQIKNDFGDLETWQQDFKKMGLIRGNGWIICHYDTQATRLFNTRVDEHHVGILAGAASILVMDVWEHAYMLDYGSDRAKYIDAFFQNIDWSTVASRFAKSRN